MSTGTILMAARETNAGGGAVAEQLRRIAKGLEERGLHVRWAADARDAQAVLRTEAGLAGALVAWDLNPRPGPAGAEGGGAEVLSAIGRRFTDLPVFLLMPQDTETGGTGSDTDGDFEQLPLWVAEVVCGYVWPLEDTAAFIAGRVAGAARQYQDGVLPPFFKALRRFDDAHQYSWHTPRTPVASRS
ncbi:Orn/Lys/Arg decarboxylase N-terminal domain-containing protein [Streptomyces griseosporeus]